MAPRPLLGLAMALLLTSLVAGCWGGDDHSSGEERHSATEVRQAFAQEGMQLEVNGVPEGGPDENDGLVVQLAPAGLLPDDWYAILWLYDTVGAAERFEEFSRENPFVVGRAEGPDSVMREGNVVTWFDGGATPDRLDRWRLHSIAWRTELGSPAPFCPRSPVSRRSSKDRASRRRSLRALTCLA